MLRRCLVLVILLLAAASLTACGSDAGSASDDAGTCRYEPDRNGTPAATPPASPAATGDTTATLHTTIGDIPLTLHGGTAPCTVNSFLALAKAGYFDDSPCHRLTTAGILVLQCGDPTGTGTGTPGYAFADELGGARALPEAPSGAETADGQKVRTYTEGTLAMANAGANTNGSQFFLVYGDSPLPPSYTVFGTISADGLKVVHQVAADGTADGRTDGAPSDDVKISSVQLP